MTVVSGSKVLIVEDEYFLAAELERFFTSLGAKVLGPVPSIRDANAHIAEADAAILDVCLNGEHVFPLADHLAERRVPFVFYTGHSEITIPERFRHVGYLSKSSRLDAVFQALFQIRTEPPRASSEENVLNAIPQLRLAARLHLGDAKAADRLVELTLLNALDHAGDKPRELAVDIWLGRLMEKVYRQQGFKLLN